MGTRSEPTGLVRIFYRSWTYFVQGYQFVSIPFTILGLSSAIYLAVKNIGFLAWLHYSDFVLGVFVIGIPITVALGWWVYHRSHFYAQQQVVTQESSPYAHSKITPQQSIAWRLNYAWAKKEGFSQIAADIKELLAKNGVDADETI